jgi:hypothetical protein
MIALIEAIVVVWNDTAGPVGFAKVTKLTGARVRTLRAAVKERPHLVDWIRAIKAYVADAKRWPERTKYGFDTLIRPSQRDKWFDANPVDTPADMSAEQADAHYTKDMR